jgi:3',5'-cyclic AMP phosphodiesterase CpdA
MWQMDRRAFLKGTSLWLLAGSSTLVSGCASVVESGAARVRFGLLTDLHYADRPPAGTRHYRETLGKVRESVDQFNALQPDLVIELGDFIDAAETVEGEIAYLERIEEEYARLRSPRHYVLGNHCVWTLTKQQFQSHCGARRPFYSFDSGGFHFVILDACYRADGVSYGARNFVWTDTDIPVAEREWLREDLQRAKGKAIIFVHQRLDAANDYAVKSAPAVRQILENSGNVLAVFQGHSHRNDYTEIHGIHYCTLAAMIEGSGPEQNAYALVSVFNDGRMVVDGFRQQKSYAFDTAKSMDPARVD